MDDKRSGKIRPKKLCLYKESIKASSTRKDITAYRNYQNTYNKAKHQAKIQYYQNKASEFITDSKKLWNILNQVIGKSEIKVTLFLILWWTV